MPIPQHEQPLYDDEQSKNQMAATVDALIPKLTVIVEEALANERQTYKDKESWISDMLNPKNILSLVALAFSIGGAFALWNRAVVTDDKLDAKMAPIVSAIDENTKSIKLIQESISVLISIDQRKQRVDQARDALSKFEDDYARRVSTWSRRRAGPYPEKSSEHIKAEITLEDAIRNRQ